MSGDAMMDNSVSRVLFLNLNLDYEVWFRKLSASVKQALETLFENQGNVCLGEYLDFEFRC